MTRTDRRRFPILLAVIAALALAMPMLFSPVQAQEGSAPDKPTPAAPQSKSEYVNAHNAGVHDLAELMDGADPLDPDAWDTEEEERKAGKQGKSVGTQQGRSNHTVDICDRTPEIEAGLLALIQETDPAVTCSTVTAEQLASVDYLYIADGYSSEEIVASDFAGLTGLIELAINGSRQLTTLPANAFSELRSTSLQSLSLGRSRIKTVHRDAFDGLTFFRLGSIGLGLNHIETLEPGTFDDVTGLEALYLNGNHIKAFEDGFFENLTELERLDISFNRIREIDGDMLSGLSSLQDLRMTSNGLSILHPDAFDDLSALERLNLQANDIAELPAAIFADGPDSLWEIRLNSNKISSLDSETFANLTGLRTLNLGYNELSGLPEDVFDSLGDSLTELNLSGNDFSSNSLPADVFDGLTVLQKLYLHRSGLASLDENLFDGLTGLQWLYLYGNSLTSLEEDLFDGLTGLQRLYLNDNDFSSNSLPADVFDGLTALQILYLHRNGLALLDENLFDPLGDSLTTLALSDNDFSSNSLPADVFDGLDVLQILYLHRSGLASLDENLFDGLTGLEKLYLYGNSLTSLDENLFDGLTGLEWLHLYDNSLISLDEDLFEGLTGLQRLYLQGNDLASLHENVFNGLSSLQRLYLDGNELTSLPDEIFDGLSSLQDLNLDVNMLSALPADVFDGLDESLTDLYLRDNDLTALPSGVFTGLTGLQRLDLSCNSLTALGLDELDPFAGTLRYLDVGANSFTNPPAEAAVNAKLTVVEALYLTGSRPCLPAFDTGLSALSLSSGTLTPEFVAPGIPGFSGYRADIGSDVSELTISVVPRDPHAEVEPAPPGSGIIYDDDLSTPGLQVHLDNRRTVRWQVRAENGAATQIYNVSVYREHPPGSVARLRSLELDGLTLTSEFGSTTYDYEAASPASATQTTVIAIPLDPDAEVAIMVDGVSAEADGTVDISPDTETVTVKVTAEDGMSTQTYTVELMQRDCSPGAGTDCDASLNSLSLSGITLDPTFSAEVTSYNASVDSDVTSTTVTAATTDEDATTAITINYVEDADGTVDLVPGYNNITVVVTAEDGTTTQTYTVTVLRAQPDPDDDSTDDTITSLLSLMDAGLFVSSASSATFLYQTAGYYPVQSKGTLSPAGFNYPAGFGPWYTVESLIFQQEGAPADLAVLVLQLEVRGAVTSVTGKDENEAYVLPADADITLHLEGDDFTWSASLDAATRTNPACVEKDGNTRRLCRVGETKAEKYAWNASKLPVLAGGEKIIVRLRYSAPRPGTPGRPLVTAPEGKSGALVVKWTAPANDDPKVRGYEVLVSPAPDGPGVNGAIRVTGGSTTRLPVLLLEPDKAYDVRVRARTYFASGPWSDTVRATTNPLVNSGTNNPVVELEPRRRHETQGGRQAVQAAQGDGDGQPARRRVPGVVRWLLPGRLRGVPGAGQHPGLVRVRGPHARLWRRRLLRRRPDHRRGRGGVPRLRVRGDCRGPGRGRKRDWSAGIRAVVPLAGEDDGRCPDRQHNSLFARDGAVRGDRRRLEHGPDGPRVPLPGRVRRVTGRVTGPRGAADHGPLRERSAVPRRRERVQFPGCLRQGRRHQPNLAA